MKKIVLKSIRPKMIRRVNIAGNLEDALDEARRWRYSPLDLDTAEIYELDQKPYTQPAIFLKHTEEPDNQAVLLRKEGSVMRYQLARYHAI